MSEPGPAKLYLVPTPIGNLGDMTYRAVETLKGLDLLLAEDTRTTGKLLKHYDIKVPMQAFHIHNEHKKLEAIIDKLKEGSKVGLVSDAGTPGLSDPGFLLARAAVEAGLELEALPGATAFLPALVQSGLPMDRFSFEGFLPHKKGRQKRWSEVASSERTLIFYESPHRILKFLEEAAEHLGAERRISLSRELTKLHEESVRGTIAEVLADFSAREAIKGEFVVVLAGAAK